MKEKLYKNPFKILDAEKKKILEAKIESLKLKMQ